jgi:hypothetical protein
MRAALEQLQQAYGLLVWGGVWVVQGGDLVFVTI